MNTKQQLQETLELFTPLFDGQNLNEDYSQYLQTVYFVEKDKMKFESQSGLFNTFEGKKSFIQNCIGAEICFVAEFWFEHPSAIRLPSTYFIYSHIF